MAWRHTWIRQLALWSVGVLLGLSGAVTTALAFSPNNPSNPNTLNTSSSPIDMAHILGADFNRRTGEPTGGHSLLKGDVRLVPGSESAPDATGVYRAHVQMADPKRPGQWLTKTDRNGQPMFNTMFPKDWTAERITRELDAAWNSPTKTQRGEKWSALTPSGVRVEGYLAPRVTAYPVFSKRQ